MIGRKSLLLTTASNYKTQQLAKHEQYDQENVTHSMEVSINDNPMPEFLGAVVMSQSLCSPKFSPKEWRRYYNVRAYLHFYAHFYLVFRVENSYRW